MRSIVALVVLTVLPLCPSVQAQPAERKSDPPAVRPADRREPTQADKDAAAAAGGTVAIGGMLCMLVWVVLGAAVYIAPTIIALLRGHPNMAPIIVVNVFLGWTLVGWVVAMAWAFTAQERHRDDYGRRRRDDYDD